MQDQRTKKLESTCVGFGGTRRVPKIVGPKMKE